MDEKTYKEIQEKIDALAMAIEILSRRLYNVIGGDTYYEIGEQLNKTVDSERTNFKEN